MTLMPSENTFASPRKRWISPVRVTPIFMPFSALRWGSTSKTAVDVELDELHPETAISAANMAAYGAPAFSFQKAIFFPASVNLTSKEFPKTLVKLHNTPILAKESPRFDQMALSKPTNWLIWLLAKRAVCFGDVVIQNNKSVKSDNLLLEVVIPTKRHQIQ